MRTRWSTIFLFMLWISGLCWTAAAAEPLQIDVNYLYRAHGDQEFRQLQDGGTLRSGQNVC